ncbi:DNA-directed RNA polymerase [Paenibacillus alvei]|uniref:DNA-directed RNA polymerase n=2 Tax=Paenibacillus alvei TaxID=44250 RepID=A0ABT4GTJ3_PAEAL|nr:MULTISPECIES: hypothetical protein [Paenibacillus]EJW18108.1 hypothetical protein PAV_3c05580 [Paenibacillus alvei DSM 29]MBG9736070.1 DNA-directed RNA polymerase [Paenibacillus alvei]MBG9743371.1 DNA-directed RNA polymerase [Paenibacillus alvei]MCY7487332.1 DNA-directed RNA polymerase [Paenibacillus alvei]MCY9542158.1 DNA-directed RNA polymerase [Paenibacillus alvei]
MKVTSFISGAAIGILAGMYLADRRSLANLQSRLQVAGNVVQDVVGKAKDKVMDASASMPDIASLLDLKMSKEAPKSDAFSLDRVKELIDRDPEVKRKVDAILRENGLAPTPSNLNAVKLETTTTTISNASKSQAAPRTKPFEENQSTH